MSSDMGAAPVRRRGPVPQGPRSIARPTSRAQRIVEGDDPLQSMATKVEPLTPSTDR
jgi:hypothetical protein